VIMLLLDPADVFLHSAKMFKYLGKSYRSKIFSASSIIIITEWISIASMSGSRRYAICSFCADILLHSIGDVPVHLLERVFRGPANFESATSGHRRMVYLCASLCHARPPSTIEKITPASLDLNNSCNTSRCFGVVWFAVYFLNLFKTDTSMTNGATKTMTKVTTWRARKFEHFPLRKSSNESALVGYVRACDVSGNKRSRLFQYWGEVKIYVETMLRSLWHLGEIFKFFILASKLIVVVRNRGMWT
jgi:hypothetical protein